MTNRPVRYLAVSLLTLAIGLGISTTTCLAASTKQAPFRDHDPSSVVTIVDEHGHMLSEMSHQVSPGDYLITEDNRGWVVSRVVGDKAYAKSDGKVDLLAPTGSSKSKGSDANLGSAVTALWDRASAALGSAVARPKTKAQQTIGIYHTHSDESYVPTTGVANKETGEGDIYKVGDALTKALEAKGFKVVHSMANHDPHDAAAYTRSRRTAVDLMKYNPVALIDVHRDAIPQAAYYQKQVSGEEIAATRVVVGKQNANRTVNLEFAKRIKAQADKKHPGLVKEIFWGKGSYNQDLGPRTILLEFGTHTNSEKLADRAALLMGDVLPVAITGSATATGGVSGAGNSQGWRSLLWVLLATVAVVGGFMAMNRKGTMEFAGKRRKRP